MIGHCTCSNLPVISFWAGLQGCEMVMVPCRGSTDRCIMEFKCMLNPMVNWKFQNEESIEEGVVRESLYLLGVIYTSSFHYYFRFKLYFHWFYFRETISIHTFFLPLFLGGSFYLFLLFESYHWFFLIPYICHLVATAWLGCKGLLVDGRWSTRTWWAAGWQY